MEDEETLKKWLKSVDISLHLNDKEVRILVGSLKDRISQLKPASASSLSNSSAAVSPQSSSTTPSAPVVEESQLDLSKCIRIKVVVVGDGAVGKTSLLISYATDKFPEQYVPTVFENYSTQIPREDGTSILLHLWDTAGQEDYDRLRPLSYPGADVVLLCFSTVNRASFNAIKEKWYPEVHHYIPKVPVLLVGTKLDCRESKQADPNLGRFDPVTPEMARVMQKEIGAVMYMEISAKTREGLVQLFQEAINTVLTFRGDPRAAGGGNAASTSATNKKKKSGQCLML